MANFLTSSIGKKFIQSVSGAFLIIFLLLHATINLFSVIDTFTGKYGIAQPDDKLFTAGDGLFKLGCDFMSTPFISLMVPVLALGFLLHIGYGIYLSVENYRKRGGLKRYEVPSKAKADSWSAKNMFVLGLVILGFIVFHLTHFWAKMQLLEFTGSEAVNNPYALLNQTFGNVVVLILYIIWFVALWLHLNHGFWSMFQTIGWSNAIWLKRLRVLGIVVSSIIALAFIAVAVNAYLHAAVWNTIAI
ncbi:MAG: succinate dehydrogenase cytochrome b subunit [Bacteroidales bacterium]|nr:succinate dehydrogenase cytochrome b subunit [Bacteroidales bacterium]